MTTYGVTPTGFVRPSVEDILALIESDQFALVSQGMDVSPESIQGQNNGIVSRQLGMAWEALETSHNGFDPDRAEDFLLHALGKITGVYPDPATKSIVTCTCALTNGTTLLAGVHFARIAGNPNSRWTPAEDYTALSTGSFNIPFEAEIAGPVEAGNGTITVIATSVVGWTTVTNSDPATPGTVAEQDPAFRSKREQQLSAAGNQTAAAIKSNLLALRHNGNQWILGVEVFENVGATPDGEGRPSKSFEVLVYDVSALRPADHDDQIAQIIWNNKPAGIQPWGFAAETGDALNEKGETVAVPFSRVTELPIAFQIGLTTVPGFTATSAVKDAVVLGCRGAFSQPGADVVALFARAQCFTVSGVQDVPTFNLGIAIPSGSTNIVVGLRQVATFTVADVAII